MLDVNHIAMGLLFQGAHPPPGRQLHDTGFHVLVLCAREHQHRAAEYPGLTVIRAPMDDGPVVPAVARATAQEVARAIRGGWFVYIACHLGFNRSGLVSALALHELTGWSGKPCVRLVQLRRPGALNNEVFASYVARLPVKQRRAGAPLQLVP